MTEFKRRNGFVQMDYPRYFVPLTLRGKVAVALKLHRGLLGLLPARAIDVFGRTRSRVFDMMATVRRADAPV
jgi:hypothetical protein